MPRAAVYAAVSLIETFFVFLKAFIPRNDDQAPKAIAVRRRTPLFAAVSTSLPKPTKEPKTGAEFPLEYCSTKSNCADLFGVGVRAKKIAVVSVNVYAVGIYLSKAGKSAVAGKFKGKKADAVAKDPALLAAVVDADAEKTLRLVFARGVGSDQVANSFSERLAPALGKESAALKSFQALFKGVTIDKGTVLTFSANKGTLLTAVNGKQVGTVASGPLVKALFNSYLGADPVSPAAKADFAANLAKAVVA